ncbi:MAG: hypothetical protein OQK98_02720 [Gammaproteobacteria bacterium]|nr:hypothetical protein [Gammaproteobacteria bacterium]
MNIMKNKTFNFVIKYLSILVVSVSTSFAANYDAGVFEFQQKLAKSGDAQAQYKLATMYENGRGVEKDNSLAMTWFKKSSSNNLEAATRYLKYLDIKKSGFKPQDEEWLKTVFRDSKRGDENALLVLGKIHESGTGVEKDLKKSRRYYKYAVNRGNTDAEVHLNRVEQAISAKEADQLQKQEQKHKAQLLALKKEEQKKQAEKNKLKRETQKQKIAKNKPAKHKPTRQLSNNNKELIRLEAERKKLARERKQLEAMRKQLAEKQAVKDKPVEEAPVTNKAIASNETQKATDVCHGKAARFMSRCQ